VQEFHPYVFQIFSQLIELRPAPLPSNYLQMLRPLLSPVLWERTGNIPPLVRLIRAYLSKAAPEIVQSGTLQVCFCCSGRLMPVLADSLVSAGNPGGN